MSSRFSAAGEAWRARLPLVVLESVLIVLSVLFALVLDRWSRERDQRRELALAVESIRSELAANKAAVQLASRRHAAWHDSLQTYFARGELPPERVYYGGLFNPAGVLSVAWESARESGAAGRLQHDVRLLLSGTYDYQARYRALGDAIVQSVYADVHRRGGVAVFRDGYANFMLLTQDFAGREERLAQAYDSTLAGLARAGWQE
jgi:type II secretory pathway pseudopilin PulG